MSLFPRCLLFCVKFPFLIAPFLVGKNLLPFSILSFAHWLPAVLSLYIKISPFLYSLLSPPVVLHDPWTCNRALTHCNTYNPNPIERNSSSPPLLLSVTFFTHPNSEHFMCIFNRWALQGPLDFNRYSLQRKSKFGAFFLNFTIQWRWCFCNQNSTKNTQNSPKWPKMTFYQISRWWKIINCIRFLSLELAFSEKGANKNDVCVNNYY